MGWLALRRGLFCRRIAGVLRSAVRGLAAFRPVPGHLAPPVAAKAAAPAAHVHGAQVAKAEASRIDKGGGIRLLARLRGGDGSIQLAPYALGPQLAEGAEGLYARLKFLIGIEGAGVLLHIGADETYRLLQHLFEMAAFKVPANEFVKDGVVLFQVGLVGQQLAQEGPILQGGAGNTGVSMG